MLFGHWHFLEGNAFPLKRMIVSRLGLRGGILLESVAASHNRSSTVHREADFSNVYERLACLTLL
jgi:exopolyphosphatase/pppGpp-phosphohydrolase